MLYRIQGEGVVFGIDGHVQVVSQRDIDLDRQQAHCAVGDVAEQLRQRVGFVRRFQPRQAEIKIVNVLESEGGASDVDLEAIPICVNQGNIRIVLGPVDGLLERCRDEVFGIRLGTVKVVGKSVLDIGGHRGEKLGGAGLQVGAQHRQGIGNTRCQQVVVEALLDRVEKGL